MNSLKVLFLDFDGVLTSKEYEGQYTRTLLISDPSSLDPRRVKTLQMLLDEVKDLKIVISSTWRNAYSLKSLRKILKVKGLTAPERVIDVTPYFPNLLRSEEIQAWLNQHPEVSNFTIVDDEPASLTKFLNKAVITNPDLGLQSEDVQALILKLFV